MSHIRRCRDSGGLATEYCELTGEVDDDYVSIGRAPDLCPLHTSAGAIAAPSPRRHVDLVQQSAAATTSTWHLRHRRTPAGTFCMC